MQVIEKNSNNVRNTSTIVIDLLLLCQILIGDNRIIILDTKLSTAKLILCKVRQKFPPPSLPPFYCHRYHSLLLYSIVTMCQKIFVQAFQGRKYYPGFIWIVIDNFVSSRWWEDQINIKLACNDKQLEDMLNYSLISGIHSPANNVHGLIFNLLFFHFN